MVEIQLDQSLCGENEKRAYGLLKTTIIDKEDAKILANKSDLPDHTLGIKFAPALRGFSEGSHFLILRTFRDNSTDVRPNRVFTHMLSGHLKDICAFDDLRLISSFLQIEPTKDAKLDSIVVKKTKQGNSKVDNSDQGRFYKLINGYVNRMDYQNTVVWVGQDGFSDAVFGLWSRLSPGERADLNFGIYFGTENLNSARTNIICIPEGLQSKFLKNGYYIVGIADTYEPKELSELILAGDPHAIQRIENFSKALGVSDLKREQVDAIVSGIKTFETLDQVTDLKKINTLSHIVATYSPDPKIGVALKTKIIEKLASLIKRSLNTDFAVIRFFKLESFANSKTDLSKAVIYWLEHVFFKPINKKSANLKPIFDLLPDKANWFSDLLRKQLGNYLSTLNKDKVKIYYQWLASFSGTMESCVKYIDKTSASEDLFIEFLPRGLGLSVLKSMKEFSVKIGWFRLHAHLLIAGGLPIEKMLKDQLLVDSNLNNSQGIEILAKKMTQTALFEFTIKNKDSRLVDICARMCVSKPSLLNAIDVKEIAWQEIWLAAIRKGNDLKNGLKSPQTIVFAVFDLLIEKKDVKSELVNEIASSEFANVRLYPQISKLWTVLSKSNRELLLLSTSSKLLGDLAKNSSTLVPNDPTLSAFIFEHGISKFLYYNSNNLAVTLPIFSKYSELKEHILCEYLNNYRGDITQKEAVLLGKLIFSKNFTEAAAIVYKRTKKNNNWQYALTECHSILGVMTKCLIFLGGLTKKVKIPSDEWWHAINDQIINFYPNMSSLTTIWKKAGGKEYDLKSGGTTRDIWVDALLRLRHKMIKHITMDSLLKEIKKDYESNPDFRTLYDIRGQFIKIK